VCPETRLSMGSSANSVPYMPQVPLRFLLKQNIGLLYQPRGTLSWTVTVESPGRVGNSLMSLVQWTHEKTRSSKPFNWP
jgi:hypothetical protein